MQDRLALEAIDTCASFDDVNYVEQNDPRPLFVALTQPQSSAIDESLLLCALMSSTN